MEIYVTFDLFIGSEVTEPEKKVPCCNILVGLSDI